MSEGVADTLPPLPPTPLVVRTVWRMRGPSSTIRAEIHRHPFGRELVVFHESREDDLIETRFERSDFSALDTRADAVKSLLQEKGWTRLAVRGDA